MSSTKPPTNEEMMEELIGVLTADLLKRIKDGDAAPSTLNVARQLLKDNNMELGMSNEPAADLNDVLKGLPFGEDSNDAQGSEGTEGFSELPMPRLAQARPS